MVFTNSISVNEMDMFLQVYKCVPQPGLYYMTTTSPKDETLSGLCVHGSIHHAETTQDNHAETTPDLFLLIPCNSNS